MNFDLTEEQRLFRENLHRLLSDRYDFQARKAFAQESCGYSAEIWKTYAELGLLGLPFSEDDGGFGGRPVESMLVNEELGRALVLEPYFATVVLAGAAIRHAGSPEQRLQLVPQIASGALRLAFAATEPQSGYDLFDVASTATRNGDGWTLSGRKALVLHGDSADMLVVTARISGNTRDKAGLGLFLVNAGAPGVNRRGYQTQDGQRGADVELDGVAAEALGTPGEAWPVIERIAHEAIAALCAEAVGVMSHALETTTEYMKVRQQFGRPIGTFQALQHRATDMLTELEQARSAALIAAMALDEPDATQRARLLSMAKVKTGRAARFVGQNAVQLHGGIGITMEYVVGHLFKRLTMIDVAFGDADYHLARLGGPVLGQAA